MDILDNVKFYKPTYIKHKSGTKEYAREYYQKNKEYTKQYYLKNKNGIKNKQKEYRENNKEYYKKYYIENKEYFRKFHRKYNTNKRKTDLKFNLNCKISKAIKLSLKNNKNGRHWETLVGYTLNDLYNHLQKTMPNGYTWQDYLNSKLHIDHIIPISVWNFDNANQIDFKRCWALENLQLLPAKENLIKNNKIDKPFQPSLKISI